MHNNVKSRCCFLYSTATCNALQGIVFAVALNSRRNALLALLIAANFVEIKGAIYKRTDAVKLWNVAQAVSGRRRKAQSVSCSHATRTAAPVAWS